MSLYRATFVLRPELEEEEKNSTVKEVQDFIVSQNGKIENVESGIQKFAFEVDKTNKGFFVSIVFEVDSSKVDGIRQFLIRKRDIIRAMLTRQEIHLKNKDKGGKKDERIEPGSLDRKSRPRS